MSKGMRNHWHQYYEDHVTYGYDEARGCTRKIIYYRCMICGHEHTDVYYFRHSEPKDKSTKALERNRKKHHG